ncbi:ABC transporter ATP-binding protein [Achromobacter deleyi]|uniref:ABC transporter ATP-binding protein n=1 Tax=Achromobacter deleyi TaxID=1353891 RepID=UPI001490A131|nr:ATP-binding cassette domain-containing protein [Achromobacter deleyi]QVQ25487.1 ATP-binding cassette domain-containing protein [Achromobacter deleyi]UIP21028.1 ATP-binding cassette domain-containing protein [Achromobacter deleyi]
MYLELRGIRKTFDTAVALEDIDLSVGEHEFVCLLGPSGCGKTTLLRIVAGLLPFDRGTITLGGRDLSALPARKRGFGIVFQSYSLFPNMTVAENVGYGLRIRGEARERIGARVRELLALIKLPDYAERYPHQLSGGQQQRVALARALAVDPALILLDEPLSALDARVRTDMRAEIHEVQRRLKIPTVMVTHDQEEALTLADKIVCMNDGRIEQVGSPSDLYLRPRTRFVANFVGLSNLLPTEWVREAMPQLLATRPEGASERYEACLRPENLRVAADERGPGRVQDLTFMGNLTRLRVAWMGRELTVEQHGAAGLSRGAPVSLAIEPGHCAWVSA